MESMGRFLEADSGDALGHSTTSLVTATILIAIGILFDKGREVIEERIAENAEPILRSLFAELTLMGFLGLVMFAVEKSGGLDKLSADLFNDSTILGGMVESVHMILFLVFVIFLSLAGYLVFIARTLRHWWRDAEVMGLEQNHKQLIQSYASELQGTAPARSCASAMSAAFFRMWMGASTAYHFMLHASLRRRFVVEEAPTADDASADSGDEGSLVRTPSLNDSGNIDVIVENETGHRSSPITLGPQRLTAHNGNPFRSKARVLAVQAAGLTQETGSPVWRILSTDGATTTMSSEEFTATYAPSGNAREYMMRQTVLAAKQTKHFLATRSDGETVTGAPGQVLVQDGDDQFVLTAYQFQQQYEPISKRRVGGHGKHGKHGGHHGGHHGGDEKHEHKDEHAPGAALNLNRLHPHDFSLAKYFSHRCGDFLGEVVEINVWGWVCVELVVLVGFASYNVFGENALLYTTIIMGFLLVGGLWALDHHLNGVMLYLLDRHLFKQAERLAGKSSRATTTPGGYGSVNGAAAGAGAGAGIGGGTGDPLLTLGAGDDEHAVEPIYTKAKKASRCCARTRGATVHDSLFIFGPNGPSFAMHTVRTALQLIGLYTAVGAIALYDGSCFALSNQWWSCLITWVLFVIPPILFLSVLPHLVYIYVIVTSVEMRKHAEDIGVVVRSIRANKALRTLRLMTSLQMKLHKDEQEKKKAQKATGHGPPGRTLQRAKSSYGVAHDAAKLEARRAELKQAYDLFDCNNDGGVGHAEISQLLAQLGFTDSRMVDTIMNEMDHDGSGEITFEEFFEWIVQMEMAAEADPEEMNRKLFEAIDKDGDGHMTVEELREALVGMGAMLTLNDVAHLIREADRDGSGSIDLEEFSAMLSRTSKFLHG